MQMPPSIYPQYLWHEASPVAVECGLRLVMPNATEDVLLGTLPVHAARERPVGLEDQHQEQ